MLLRLASTPAAAAAVRGLRGVAWLLRVAGWRRRLRRRGPRPLPARTRARPSGSRLARRVLRVPRRAGRPRSCTARGSRPGELDGAPALRELRTVVAKRLRGGRRVLILAAHHCNWEWLLLRCSTAVRRAAGRGLQAASRRARGPRARGMRSRFGATMVPAKELVQHLIAQRGTGAAARDARRPVAVGEERTADVAAVLRPARRRSSPGRAGSARKLGLRAVFHRHAPRGPRALRRALRAACSRPGERADAGRGSCAAYVRALEQQVREHPASTSGPTTAGSARSALYD